MSSSPVAESPAVDCPLCEEPGETLWSHPDLFVIEVDDPGYPGYTRVVWRHHVAEMTSLSMAERDRLMSVVWCVEAAQRGALRPHKVNLASLGNEVPHLHWHVIPRWRDDPAYPSPIWASVRRQPVFGRVTEAHMVHYRAQLAEALPRLAASWQPME